MEKNRLIWACRRGMLELDILLSRFVEEHYDLLSEDEKLRFDVLLECEDQDLYNWLVKKQTPQSASIEVITKIINKSIMDRSQCCLLYTYPSPRD